MNDSRSTPPVTRHEFCVKDRRVMTVSGVKEILSFDEQSVRMLTASGDMAVEGDGLRVKVLDVERGCVSLEGRIDGIRYLDEEPSERRGFWSRLVK